MSQDFVHVTRASSAGWVVVSLGGRRSIQFLSRLDAVDHAESLAREIGAVVGHSIGVRLQDERGRWVNLELSAVATPN